MVVIKPLHSATTPHLSQHLPFTHTLTDQRCIDFSVSKIELVIQGIRNLVNIIIVGIIQRFILCYLKHKVHTSLSVTVNEQTS